MADRDQKHGGNSGVIAPGGGNALRCWLGKAYTPKKGTSQDKRTLFIVRGKSYHQGQVAKAIGRLGWRVDGCQCVVRAEEYLDAGMLTERFPYAVPVGARGPAALFSSLSPDPASVLGIRQVRSTAKAT